MASISKLMETKDGRRYWKISVSRGYGKTPYTTRFYWPDGWSKTSAERGLSHAASDFESKCKDGLVMNRAERAEIKAAEAKAAAEAAEAAAQLKTFEQYASAVYMKKKEKSIAENTRLSYWSNLNQHIFPRLGNYLMIDINQAMITSLLLDFQESHSYGSTIKVYNILNAIFKMAYKDDTICKNPMDKVDRPNQKKDDKAITEADKALFEDDLIYILECVQNEPLKWQVFMYLAADTGCRRGELVGLQWSDINWKKKTISIRHNLQYSKAKGVYDVTPKGGRFRTVDLGDDTIAILKEYKSQLTEESDNSTGNNSVIDINDYRKKEEKKLPKWIFTIEGSDEPMHPTSPTHYFRQFGKRYNVPGFHPHLLRHTSASLSLTHGGDVKSIAERLGHKDASVTLKMYAHANDESIRAAGQAARDALKKRIEEQKKKESGGA